MAASAVVSDIYDNAPWTDMAVEDLVLMIRRGRSIEDTAEFLCRPVDQVMQKAVEMGLVRPQ